MILFDLILKAGLTFFSLFIEVYLLFKKQWGYWVADHAAVTPLLLSVNRPTDSKRSTLCTHLHLISPNGYQQTDLRFCILKSMLPTVRRRKESNL